MPEKTMVLDGVRYVVIPESEFAALLSTVAQTVRLATVLAEQHSVEFVTPEFRAAFAEGMRNLEQHDPAPPRSPAVDDETPTTMDEDGEKHLAKIAASEPTRFPGIVEQFAREILRLRLAAHSLRRSPEVTPDADREEYWKRRTASRASEIRTVTGEEWNAVTQIFSASQGERFHADQWKFALHCVEDLGEAEWRVRRDRDRLADELASLRVTTPPASETRPEDRRDG